MTPGFDVLGTFLADVEERNAHEIGGIACDEHCKICIAVAHDENGDSREDDGE